MVFGSTSFLFVFLPLFLLLYIILPWKNVVLLIASLIFYSWGEGTYVLLLIITIAVNYYIGRQIALKRNLWRCAIGVAINVLILTYFKYVSFILVDLFGLSNLPLKSPHLPLGISFFIFQSISYLVDVYRKEAKPASSVLDLAVYISMFPQLIAGPIVRYASVAERITHRETTFEDVKNAVKYFITGLAFKVLIADNVGEIADRCFSIPVDSIGFLGSWIGVFAYTLQIFYDFAGYSLMAIGLGYVLGFRFPQNFNDPYISKSVTEFWRRWHMSLSSWFRDYVYIPLGGNRKGSFRTQINLLGVFVLCGLWHGAQWTFLVWGLWHGLFLMIERSRLFAALQSSRICLQHIYCLLVVVIGWVFFRSDNLQQAFGYLSAMFSLRMLDQEFLYSFVSNKGLAAAMVGSALCVPVVRQILSFKALPDSSVKKTFSVIFLHQPISVEFDYNFFKLLQSLSLF